VFCSTREEVKRLHASLLERGFGVVALSGELSQNERLRALHALRNAQARVCVATDVAARGLDLPDLGLVIHADLPQNPQALLHRSGRTGRAGKKGTSVLVVPVAARGYATRLLSAGRIDAVWSPPPSPEAIRERDHERLAAEIAALSEDADEEDLAVAQALLRQRSAVELAVALVHLHGRLMPSAEELTPVAVTIPPPPPRRPFVGRPPPKKGPRGRPFVRRK
jgi:ATP-dependent RNA helicase DeaD